MLQIIAQLVLVSLVPIGAAVVFALLEKHTKFKNIKKWQKWIITGLIFGAISVLGSIWGVRTTEGYIINIRDAAPIIAGLMFGGPAGIIAGFIGGLFRFVSVYWGASGTYTQLACSLATLMAGVFTALARKFMFDDEHGHWYYGFFLGVLVEVFHMMMVFLTHMNDVANAYDVVKVCSIPMIFANSLAVMVALIFVSLIYKEKLVVVNEKRKISTRIQFTLLISLVVAYLVTGVFSYSIISNTVNTNTQTIIASVMSDTKKQVDHTIEVYFHATLEAVKIETDEAILNKVEVNTIANTIMGKYQLSEVNIVGKDNIIKGSTIPDYIGFDMNAYEQSREFSCLNEGENFYIQEIREPASKLEVRTKYAGVRLNENEQLYGYIQIGLYQDAYHKLLDSVVCNSAQFRHINSKGYMVITDNSGVVISTVDDAPIGVGDTIEYGMIRRGEFQTYSLTVQGKTYTYYAYATYQEGYYIIGLADVEECDLPIKIGFLGLTLAEIFIFIILYGVLYILIKQKVVRRIDNICGDLNSIALGNLSIQVNERGSYEFDELSTDINKTVDTLKGYIEKESLKNAEELEFAKSIQHSAIPNVFPLTEKFEIFASMDTAKQVGGDFYDFYYIDREHMIVQIADVSGKGIPAAMFMMQSKTILKSLIGSGMDIDEAYTEANRRLSENNTAQMFVTCWVAMINLSTGHVDYVNAGHNPPILGHEDGSVEYIRGKSGFVLAGFPGFKYQKQSFEMKPGDFLFLYTDGVTEAMNVKSELYGENRLINLLEDSKPTSKQICTRVLKDVKKFVGEAEQSDDITMLCFCLHGNESNNIMVIEANTENIPKITAFVEGILEEAGANPKAMMQIDVAIDEILSNICFYAYKQGQAGKAKITVDFDKTKENVKLIFEDRGIDYNPLEKEDPNITLSAEERQIGGLGIFIVKQTMDSVEYENVNGHNILTLTKKIK